MLPPALERSRREFLRLMASLSAGAAVGVSWPRRSAWAADGAAATPAAGRSRAARATEPWGSLECVGPQVWAMLSTPLADRTTLCNGGLIGGRDGVLMVEAFGSDAGARWMRERARELTRLEPTHVLLTHYHADHTAGLRAACEAGAQLWCTARTRDDILKKNQNPPAELLVDAVLVPEGGERTLDLGGRRLRVLALDGHTASDLAIVVEGPDVVFAGDLIWYGMFPNFVDATPSRLSQSVRRLRALEAPLYVSGHGQLCDRAGLDAYLELLDLVEHAARDAQARGLSAEAAGNAFRLPPAMADWTLFNQRYFERAIGAWMRELTPR